MKLSELIIKRMMEKRADGIVGNIIDGEWSKAADKTRSGYNRFINQIAEYMPEGKALKAQYSRTNPGITVAGIRQMTEMPITENSRIAKNLSVGNVLAKQYQRAKEYKEGLNFVWPWELGKFKQMNKRFETPATGPAIATDSIADTIADNYWK